jgi:phage gp36-like protein
MPYSTVAELTDRYSAQMLLDLSFRGDTEPTVPDTALFDRAIADADAQIDGYLKVRYQLPLASVPRLITDLSLRLSIYNAHGQAVSEKIMNDHREALRTLGLISKGEIKLDIAGIEPAGGGTQGVTTNEPERPITAKTMKGYI